MNKEIIIGIDGNEANIKNRVGVNTYAYDLLCYINKLCQKGQFEGKPIRIEVYLKEKPLPDMPKTNKFWKYKIIPGSTLWILTKLTPFLRKTSNADVMFSPSHYVPFLSRIPKVCSIMDLGYLEFSAQFKKYDYWQLKLWTAISLKVSKHIITISSASKKDIMRHYPRTKGKVTVTYPGYDEKRFNTRVSPSVINGVKKRYSIVGDYVLFLSTLKPSKNVEGLLRAFKSVSKANPDIKLAISGKKGWLYDTIFKSVDESIRKNVIFTDFVDEKDKPALIRGAKVFVLPSFWEGFGLDPLYSMASGVPVVVSNRGSLPEVVGSAGLLVNPDDEDEISEKINKVLSFDKIEYNKMVDKGIAQAKKFSWEETAKKTLKILVGVATNNK